MKITVLGKIWKVKVLTPRGYTRIHGTDSDAITDLAKRTIYFRNDEFNTEVIRHELFHAFLEESMISRTDPTVLQVEELGAEIMGRYGPEICALAEDVFNYFS